MTLSEPLAAAFGLTVEELMACRRRETRGQEDETMKALLDITGDSVRAEKCRGWSRLIAVMLLLLATVLGIFYAVTFQSAQDKAYIRLKEACDGEGYLYIRDETDPGHLLRLKCGDSVDFDAIELTNEWDVLLEYRLTYCWNRWTRQGLVSACEPTGNAFLGSMMDVTSETEYAPLFGQSTVYYTSESYYPDPYGEPRGRTYLCDFRCWTGDVVNDTDRTVLLVEDCKSAVVTDIDHDGENEVVVRTRWPEKPSPSTTWWTGRSRNLGRIRCLKRFRKSWCASGRGERMKKPLSNGASVRIPNAAWFLSTKRKAANCWSFAARSYSSAASTSTLPRSTVINKRAKNVPRSRVPRPGPYHSASKTVSRVLYLTVIYLDVPLPARSSHPGSGRASLGVASCSHTGVAPNRVYSDGLFPAIE